MTSPPTETTAASAPSRPSRDARAKRRARPAPVDDFTPAGMQQQLEELEQELHQRDPQAELTAVAKAIADQIRPGDLAARLGGEEFAVFHVAGDDAPTVVAERIRRTVAALAFDEPGLTVTTSAGVAERRPGETYGAVLARADAALYEAKESGRDRTVLAAP